MRSNHTKQLCNHLHCHFLSFSFFALIWTDCDWLAFFIALFPLFSLTHIIYFHQFLGTFWDNFLFVLNSNLLCYQSPWLRKKNSHNFLCEWKLWQIVFDIFTKTNFLFSFHFSLAFFLFPQISRKRLTLSWTSFGARLLTMDLVFML